MAEAVCRFWAARLSQTKEYVLRPSSRRFRDQPVLWPRVVLRTQDQTHYFNCPYQVCAHDVGRVASESADAIEAVTKHGDILVAATDGVVDNLFDMQIQEIVATHLREIYPIEGGWRGGSASCLKGLRSLAKALAEAAMDVGSKEDDRGTLSPFGRAAAEEEGYDFPGGKLDDVTVVCGLVMRAPTEVEEAEPSLQSNF